MVVSPFFVKYKTWDKVHNSIGTLLFNALINFTNTLHMTSPKASLGQFGTYHVQNIFIIVNKCIEKLMILEI